MQVAEVEDVVNESITKSLPVYAQIAPLEQASAIYPCHLDLSIYHHLYICLSIYCILSLIHI